MVSQLSNTSRMRWLMYSTPIPVFTEPVHDGEQGFGLRLGEGRGRLVEDDQAAVHGERLGDLHDLLLGNGELRDPLARPDVGSEGGKQLRGPPVVPAHVHDELVGVVDRAHEDVFRHCEVLAESDLLVDEPDAQLLRIVGGIDPRLGAVDDDGPLVGLVDPGDHVHERRLPRAVFPHHGMDAAGGHGQAHAGERLCAGEPLADVLYFEDRGAGHLYPPRFPEISRNERRRDDLPVPRRRRRILRRRNSVSSSFPIVNRNVRIRTSGTAASCSGRSLRRPCCCVP